MIFGRHQSHVADGEWNLVQIVKNNKEQCHLHKNGHYRILKNLQHPLHIK